MVPLVKTAVTRKQKVKKLNQRCLNDCITLNAEGYKRAIALFWSEMYHMLSYSIIRYFIVYILISYCIAWCCIVLHCIVLYVILCCLMLSDSIARYCFVSFGTQGCVSQDAYIHHLKDGFPKGWIQNKFCSHWTLQKVYNPVLSILNSYKRKQVPNVKKWFSIVCVFSIYNVNNDMYVCKITLQNEVYRRLARHSPRAEANNAIGCNGIGYHKTQFQYNPSNDCGGGMKMKVVK